MLSDPRKKKGEGCDPKNGFSGFAGIRKNQHSALGAHGNDPTGGGNDTVSGGNCQFFLRTTLGKNKSSIRKVSLQADPARRGEND